MDVYLAGLFPYQKNAEYRDTLKKERPFVLESFFYARECTERNIPLYGKFLLDSGAYTMFGSPKADNVVWEDYVDRYAEFIVKNNVKLFFELDIDKLVGFQKVLLLRKRLENATGRQSIPVWHKSRGKEDFIRMCQEYKYVSIGGLVGAGGAGTSAYAVGLTKYFPWFIETAHRKGAKIHALGYTSIQGLKKYHFDSVDSTSWSSGGRFGMYYRFSGETLSRTDRREGKRISNMESLCLHNYKEWIKFQKYAEVKL